MSRRPLFEPFFASARANSVGMASLLRELSEPRIVIAGASGGIGFAMLSALAERFPRARIEALARRPEQRPKLLALAEQGGGAIRLHRFDLGDEAGLLELGARLSAEGPIHLLLFATGILHGEGLQPEKSLAQLDAQAVRKVFAVNALGPLLLTKAMLPALRGTHPVVVAALSARVGSIGDNRLGGWYAYRASKAALNQLFRTVAVELRRLNPKSAVLLLHPGTVDTLLSAPFSGGMQPRLTPEAAASRLLALIVDAQPSEGARFLAYDGNEVPW